LEFLIFNRWKVAIPFGWNAAITSTPKAMSASLARPIRGLRTMLALLVSYCNWPRCVDAGFVAVSSVSAALEVAKK
jgi:hypothetical protein